MPLGAAGVSRLALAPLLISGLFGVGCGGPAQDSGAGPAGPQSSPGPATHAHAQPEVLAPGYAELAFTPPPAGSYRLPPLGLAADGALLDSQGDALRLHDLFGDKLVLLSFIYTRCPDVNGCPLATHVLRKMQERIRSDAGLGDQVRLLSLSFDPDHDTPQVLREYAGHFRAPDFDWRFLTAASEADLAPILEQYNQWVIRDPDGGAMSHLLRVYLIDRQGRLRNIYSVAFLHADVLANDAYTLLSEAGGAPGQSSG